MTGGEDAPRRRRWLYTAGAVAAAVIAVVFATVGDGVETPDDGGWSRLIVAWGHQVVWALLAGALAVAALRGRWQRASEVLAVAAAVVYAAFLAAVFLGGS